MTVQLRAQSAIFGITKSGGPISIIELSWHLCIETISQRSYEHLQRQLSDAD